MTDRYWPTPEKEHKARLLIGDPVACAYAWIVAYAENLTNQVGEGYDYGGNSSSIDAEELISAAMSHWEGENSRYGGEYIVRGGTFEGVGTDPTFYDKLAIVLGKEIPKEDRNNFFSCSC